MYSDERIYDDRVIHARSTLEQDLNRVLWSTPVDLAPQYSGCSLFVHYGSPVITSPSWMPPSSAAEPATTSLTNAPSVTVTW